MQRTVQDMNRTNLIFHIKKKYLIKFISKSLSRQRIPQLNKEKDSDVTHDLFLHSLFFSLKDYILLINDEV